MLPDRWFGIVVKACYLLEISTFISKKVVKNRRRLLKNINFVFCAVESV